MKLTRISTLVLAAVLLGIMVASELQIVAMRRLMVQHDRSVVASQSASEGVASQQEIMRLASSIIPRGIPAVRARSGELITYGTELGVSFDAAAQGIEILAQHEQDTRTNKLIGEKLERYIKIGSQTSCEYCCAARTLVFPDGNKACACAHSAAMRGVAAYLIDRYGDQLTDEQILTEVNRFKASYFPRQSVQKVLAASQGGSINAGALNQLAPQVGGC